MFRNPDVSRGARGTLAPVQTMMKAAGNSRALFLLTILTGSFLLFLVQPMIARMALPRLGGAPAVWNSAMLVYQALLLAGYAYAHRLTQATSRQQAIIHIALFVVALMWLPIGLANLQPPADGSPIFWVPWLLIASIGPLFFMVASQAPLMQRWYALSGNQGEPYALYAASNIGSFGGLIAYPLLVEPFTTLNSQKWIWSSIYVALLLLVCICALQVWRSDDAGKVQPEHIGERVSIAWKRRLYWIILAAVPSGLMLSTTSHLTTDLMAMPLIWVIPLGIYLLSFSVAFADNQKPAYWISRLAPIVLIVSGAFVFVVWGKAAISGLAASLSLLFFVAVALHHEMYRTRPAPSELTSFYLMMSLGGVIGGFFCAIVAPLLFDWTWEHPILILLAAALLPAVPLLRVDENNKRIAVVMTIVGLTALGLGIFGGITEPAEPSFLSIMLASVIVMLGLAVAGFRLPFLLAVAGLLTINGGYRSFQQTLDGVRMRSYFGTYTVNSTESGRVRWLNHGTTMHGMQLLDDPTRPISYYPETSGVGIALQKAPALFGPNATVGIVGLGTGTLGCYKKPGQNWTFFEIDPLVIEIARDRKIFSFLEKCAPDVKITLGDARLTLADVPKGRFDILALDAFSSDSIPLHLLTKEAFATYRRTLKPDGLLLVHISNRYIDLNPVIAAEAKANGWYAALRHDSPTQDMINRGNRASQWIALSPDPAKLAQLTGPVNRVKSRYYDSDQWLHLDPPGNVEPWTDDYASVLPHLSLWKIL
ncbi:fused MFS/spermidine synthase [Sphingorhabdus sp.]|uniref:fused MFS/spermidine synthase n=1 Tax=Sphingorhabdus sp. TaxID=1902408 RepID=UPI00359421A6